MILKVCRIIVNKEEKAITEESFFDSFDYMTTKKCFIGETEKPCGSYSSSWFTFPNSLYVTTVHLMKGELIVRYIVIDANYSVYLMSDVGKTIERIN